MTNADVMTCQELVELITDYLEDALPVPDRSLFEANISDGAGCSEYLEQIRRTVEVSGALSEDTLEPRVRSRLMDSFRSWRQSEETPRSPSS